MKGKRLELSVPSVTAMQAMTEGTELVDFYLREGARVDLNRTAGSFGAVKLEPRPNIDVTIGNKRARVYLGSTKRPTGSFETGALRRWRDDQGDHLGIDPTQPGINEVAIRWYVEAALVYWGFLPKPSMTKERGIGIVVESPMQSLRKPRIYSPTETRLLERRQEARLQVGETVLMVWHDDHKPGLVQAILANVTDVNDRNYARVRATWFSETGCNLDNNDGMRGGWIAPAKYAHVMLSSIRWLTDEQRQIFWELLITNRPFPFDWLTEAAASDDQTP
jgi:hypothetical protein